MQGNGMHTVAGGKVGRRGNRQRLPKAYLVDLFSRLRDHGIGCYGAQNLTGYSRTIVAQYQRLAGKTKVTHSEMHQRLIDALPPELAAECKRVRTRSVVAHERAAARVTGVCASVRKHELVDEDEDACVNQDAGGRGAPKRNVTAA